MSRISRNYCRELVRKFDNNGFMVALFTPLEYRDALWAIRAFNIEISQIQDSVKDSNFGKMRISWWRTTIDNIFAGQPNDHPVSLEIAKALEHTRLSKSFFKKILNARELHLTQSQFPTMNALEQYSEDTLSSLLYLHLEALGINDHSAEHAVGHIGKAAGIATMLRAFLYNLEKQRVTLPSEVMAKHNISSESLFRNEHGSKLNDVIFEVATRANDQLLTARSFNNNLPTEARPALITAVEYDSYLKRLEKADFDIFNANLNKKQLSFPFKLWMASKTGKF